MLARGVLLLPCTTEPSMQCVTLRLVRYALAGALHARRTVRCYAARMAVTVTNWATMIGKRVLVKDASGAADVECRP